MAFLTPSQFVEIVTNEFDFYAPPRKLQDYLIELLVERDLAAVSELSAYEWVEKNRGQYIDALRRAQNEAINQGKFCRFVYHEIEETIVGFSYSRDEKDHQHAEIKKLAPLHDPVAAHIRGISPDDFEVFCRKLLALLDVRNVRNTQLTRDGGLDFFGELFLQSPLASSDFRVFEDDLRLIIIGQAKRYDLGKNVTEPEVRDLLGATAIFSHHGILSEQGSSKPVMTVRLYDPILPIFLTTSGFTGPARSLAKRSGIVIKDGAQIATFICLKHIGITSHGEEYIFDSSKFDDWLHSV